MTRGAGRELLYHASEGLLEVLIGSWAMDAEVYGKAKLPLLNPSGTSYPMEAS